MLLESILLLYIIYISQLFKILIKIHETFMHYATKNNFMVTAKKKKKNDVLI